MHGIVYIEHKFEKLLLQRTHIALCTLLQKHIINRVSYTVCTFVILACAKGIDYVAN